MINQKNEQVQDAVGDQGHEDPSGKEKKKGGAGGRRGCRRGGWTLSKLLHPSPGHSTGDGEGPSVTESPCFEVVSHIKASRKCAVRITFSMVQN